MWDRQGIRHVSKPERGGRDLVSSRKKTEMGWKGETKGERGVFLIKMERAEKGCLGR